MLAVAVIYFIIAAIVLIRQRDRKKALVTILVLGLLLAFVAVAAILEWTEDGIRWNPPQR